jgi:carboxymethylenebutenolidase
MAVLPTSPDPVRESTDSFASGGHRVRVDQFDPAGAGRRPAVLLLHGSDGVRYRADMYRRIARGLAADGYPALLVHYFDSTGGSRPAAIPVHFLTWMQAVGDAITYATARPQADPGRVGLIGFSLGAYLALPVAAQDPRVAAVVECSGGLADVFAPGLERMPPVLILHGESDPLVPATEARKLERLLRGKGLPCETHIYPGQGHVFTGDASADALRRARLFLENHLRPEG